MYDSNDNHIESTVLMPPYMTRLSRTSPPNVRFSPFPSLALTYPTLTVPHLGLHSATTNDNIGLVKYAFLSTVMLSWMGCCRRMLYQAGGLSSWPWLLIEQGVGVRASRCMLISVYNLLITHLCLSFPRILLRYYCGRHDTATPCTTWSASMGPPPSTSSPPTATPASSAPFY